MTGGGAIRVIAMGGVYLLAYSMCFFLACLKGLYVSTLLVITQVLPDSFFSLFSFFPIS